MEKILVIFEATDDRVEGLALAFGLGAVQKKALIRLRHLNPAPQSKLAHQSYGSLQSADVQWADGVAIFLEEQGSEPAANLQALRQTLQASELSEPARIRWFYVLSANPDSSVVEAIAGWLPPGFERFKNGVVSGPATPESTKRVGQQFASFAVTPATSPFRSVNPA